MTFKDIKGQEQAIQILKSHIDHSRLASAYLFVGPEGIGKCLVAKILAKVLNCLKTTSDSCDACASCLKIEHGQHPDVHIIDNQDAEIKIEDIRELQSKIGLRPYEGRYKVFIVKNAHNLNSASANAFLKTLEESPPHSLIILVTEKPALLLKTIISRCQIVRFYPLKRHEVEEALRRDYGLKDNLAHYLAYFCEGRIAHALRLKDRDMLEEKNRVIDEYTFLKDPRREIQAVQNKEAMRDSLNILAAWFRDIYLLKSGVPHSELINLDRKNELLKIMQHFSFLDLEDRINFISEALFYLGHNVNIKLLQSNLRIKLWKG